MATIPGAPFRSGARKEQRLLFGELCERRSIISRIKLFSDRIKHFGVSVDLRHYNPLNLLLSFSVLFGYATDPYFPFLMANVIVTFLAHVFLCLF